MNSKYSHDESYDSSKKEFYLSLNETYLSIGKNISSAMQNEAARKLIDASHLKVSLWRIQHHIVLEIIRNCQQHLP